MCKCFFIRFDYILIVDVLSYSALIISKVYQMSWSKGQKKRCKINTAALKDTEKQPFATFWRLIFLIIIFKFYRKSFKYYIHGDKFILLLIIMDVGENNLKIISYKLTNQKDRLFLKKCQLVLWSLS